MTTPNTTSHFKRSFPKKTSNKIWKWVKNNVTYRRVEVIATIAAVAIAYFSLKSSNEALRLTREANVASDSNSAKTYRTSKQLAEASQKAVEASQKAADASTRFADAAAENLKLAKQSAEAQIQSLKESQKQFEVTNNPYLQIKLVDREYSAADSLMTGIYYNVKNVGKHPIKLINESLHSQIGNSPPKVDSMLHLSSNALTEYIITESSEMQVDVPTNGFINDANDRVGKAHDFFNHKTNVYFFGYFIYVNLLNEEVFRYLFILELRPDGHTILYNENEKLKR